MTAKENEKQVSMSNTKKEMLEAYNQLLTELKEKEKTQLKPEIKKAEKEKKEVIESTDKILTEGFSKSISTVKDEFTALINNVSDGIEQELKNYDKLKRAVEIKEAELSEIYEIEKEALTLSSIIEAQRAKKEELISELEEEKYELEEEIEETRDEWKKEKAGYEIERKEIVAEDNKKRMRLKEEFEYNFKLERKQAKDKFEAEKAALERELAAMKEETEKSLTERESIIEKAEEELNSLRQEVEKFPVTMEKEINRAVKHATEKIIMESEHKESLLKAEFSGEKNVMTTKIESLEKTIAEQAKLIETYSQRLEKSYNQVQDIAMKAVDKKSEGKTYYIPQAQNKDEHL